MQVDELRQILEHGLSDMKGVDITTLDVRRLTDITDYMIIVTGTSDRHVKSMAHRLQEDLRGRGLRPIGVEGERDGDWILLDFADVVVHLMQAESRGFYDLERLWNQEMEDLVKAQRKMAQSGDQS